MTIKVKTKNLERLESVRVRVVRGPLVNSQELKRIVLDRKNATVI